MPSVDAVMEDVRYYFRSAMIVLFLAIVASVSMTSVGMKSTDVSIYVSPIMGFAALIIFQYRTAATTASAVADATRAAVVEVQKVKAALEVSDLRRSQLLVEAVNKVQDVKVALEASDRRRAGQLAEIQATGKATHSLVNSDHGMALRALADALRQLARLTDSPADERAARHAEDALREHDQRQAGVDREQERDRIAGLSEA